MLLIKNGKILTMAGKTYGKGDIFIKNGKIENIGENLEFPSNAEVIDAKGMIVMPGFIEAHCHIGLFEQGIGFEGADGNEVTDPITPQLRAIDGINPMDTAFEDARKAGITLVATGPGSANVLGGQFAAIKTEGICIDNMIVKENVAMKVAFGENPKRVYNGKGKSPMTRMATAALLRETLLKANNYKVKVEKAKVKDDYFERDLKMEALLPVINREIPLKAHAHRADDILTAIRIAKEFNLRLSLEHCSEGDIIASFIKDAEVPAVIGPTMTSKSKVEVKNKSFKTAGNLSKLGIKVAITTDHPIVPIEYLPICAAYAVKEGMDYEEALKAITINAAEILHLEDRVGSIETGKDADIVILDGCPLEISSSVLYTIIDGKIVYKKEN